MSAKQRRAVERAQAERRVRIERLNKMLAPYAGRITQRATGRDSYRLYLKNMEISNPNCRQDGWPVKALEVQVRQMVRVRESWGVKGVAV